MTNPPPLPRPRQVLHDLAVGLAKTLRFFSRLPVPALPGEADAHAAPDLSRLMPLVPVAGALMGLGGAAVLAAGEALGLGSWICAVLALAALALLTGALHEDGLADTADGLWGGSTRERRLEIMRDSRLGSYGALALGLVLLLRVGALAELLDRAGPAAGAAAMVLAAALSRCAALAPLAALPPARSDGAAHAAGRPSWPAMALAGIVAAGIATALALAGLVTGAGAVLSLLAAAAAAAGVVRLARRLLGGQTGDVAGAAQQLSEAAVLVVLVAAAGA